MSNIFSKRLLLFSSILLIILLLAACGGNDENASEKGSSNSAEGEGSSKSTTIKIMTNLHTPEVPDDVLLKVLEEKTNYRLDIDWVPDNNYNEKLNTAFATGTLPQVVSVGFQQFDQFREAIIDDQFWEIGPYLSEFENLSKLKEPVLNNTKVEGKVYGLYQGRPLSRQGFIYRKDWADNLGLSAPTTT